MKSQALTMIGDCIDNIVRMENIHEQEAFKRLLNYAAYKLSIGDAMVRFKQPTYDYVTSHFSVDVLKQNTWDWFGEYYELIFRPSTPLSTRKSLNKHVNKCLDMIESEGGVTPPPVLDKSVGTGRFFIMVKERAKRDLMYYGIEHDLLAYKICLINMKLYNIPARILWCQDGKKIDIAPNSRNWSLSNYWNPVSQDRLSKV